MAYLPRGSEGIQGGEWNLTLCKSSTSLPTEPGGNFRIMEVSKIWALKLSLRVPKFRLESLESLVNHQPFLAKKIFREGGGLFVAPILSELILNRYLTSDARGAQNAQTGQKAHRIRCWCFFFFGKFGLENGWKTWFCYMKLLYNFYDYIELLIFGIVQNHQLWGIALRRYLSKGEF